MSTLFFIVIIGFVLAMLPQIIGAALVFLAIIGFILACIGLWIKELFTGKSL